MSRFWDITWLILLLPLVFGLVDGLGIVPDGASPQITTATDTYEVSDLNEFSGGEGGTLDYFAMAVAGLAWAWGMIVSIAKAYVCLYPVLVDKLGIPAGLSAIFQFIIYLNFLIFALQFRSKNGGWGGYI